MQFYKLAWKWNTLRDVLRGKLRGSRLASLWHSQDDEAKTYVRFGTPVVAALWLVGILTFVFPEVFDFTDNTPASQPGVTDQQAGKAGGTPAPTPSAPQGANGGSQSRPTGNVPGNGSRRSASTSASSSASTSDAPTQAPSTASSQTPTVTPSGDGQVPGNGGGGGIKVPVPGVPPITIGG